MLIISLFYLFVAGVPFILEKALHSFLNIEPMTLILIIGAICIIGMLGLGTVLFGGVLRGLGRIISVVVLFLLQL